MKKISLIIIFLFCSIYILAEDNVSVSSNTFDTTNIQQVDQSTDAINISTNTTQVIFLLK